MKMKLVLYATIGFITLFTAVFAEQETALHQEANHPAPNVLKERLKKAKSGDFFVAESNKMISILAIRSITAHSLILEEITVPASSLNPRPTSWSDWIKKRAPGHTSWSMIEIDLQNHQMLECYSFTRSAWMQLSSQDSLIPILLSLPLAAVPESSQRRIGPAPMDGEADNRKIWKPPLVIHGLSMANTEFSVYEADWPKDSSQLSGNKVSLYFDRANHTPFPVWIQIDTSHATASLRVIDAGKGLPSLHRGMPRRVPEFIGTPQKTESGMRLSLKSPKYYRTFDLFAVDVTTREKQILPVTHSLIGGDGEILQIEIDQEELQTILKPDHRYTWLLVPNGHSESYTESPKSFIWKAE
jgi:hypothetical protein